MAIPAIQARISVTVSRGTRSIPLETVRKGLKIKKTACLEKMSIMAKLICQNAQLSDVVIEKGKLFGVGLFSFKVHNFEKKGRYESFATINKHFNPIMFGLLNSAHVSIIHFPKDSQESIPDVLKALFEKNTDDAARWLYQNNGKLYNGSNKNPHRPIGQR